MPRSFTAAPLIPSPAINEPPATSLLLQASCYKPPATSLLLQASCYKPPATSLLPRDYTPSDYRTINVKQSVE
jgi:hypothetical protein